MKSKTSELTQFVRFTYITILYHANIKANKWFSKAYNDDGF